MEQKELLKPIIDDGENDELMILISRMKKTDVDKLRKIVRYLARGVPEDIIYLLLNTKFSRAQEENIIDGVLMGIPIKLLSRYATPDVDADVIDFFNDLFVDKANDIADDDLDFAFNSRFNPDQSLAICTAIIELRDRALVEMYADPKFDDAQMEVIYEGLICGLSPEDVNKYVDPKLTPIEMDWMRINMLDN
jgi:hypothetical protein